MLVWLGFKLIMFYHIFFLNLNVQIDDLTDKLNAASTAEKKDNEESNIRTVQTEKPN
jgi:hypothetical protein